MSEASPPPIVLASSSPYRRDLISRLPLAFNCHSPNIDETPQANETTPMLCSRLAMAKAQALADLYPCHLLIGCDQSASTQGYQLHKPGSAEKAFKQLSLLSGQIVTFYTSIALINTGTGETATDIDATRVHFRQLSEEEINRYLAIEQPYDCAGSFKAEGLGISLFDKIVSDDPTALIGLPMIKLCRLLRGMRYAIP